MAMKTKPIPMGSGYFAIDGILSWKSIVQLKTLIGQVAKVLKKERLFCCHQHFTLGMNFDNKPWYDLKQAHLL